MNSDQFTHMRFVNKMMPTYQETANNYTIFSYDYNGSDVVLTLRETCCRYQVQAQIWSPPALLTKDRAV